MTSLRKRLKKVKVIKYVIEKVITILDIIVMSPITFSRKSNCNVINYFLN